MPTAYLHIGMHKTGTTTFQQFLMERKPWLLSQGYHVPSTGQSPGGAHHVLARGIGGMLGDIAMEEQIRNALEAELLAAGAPNAILSSESMSTLFRSDIFLDRFIDYFKSIGYSTCVIIYIRLGAISYNSAYSQIVKQLTYSASFSEYLNDYLPFADYDALWRPLHDCRRIELIARPYDRSVRRNGIVHEIGRDIGFVPPADIPLPLNVSPGPIQIHLARRLHRARADAGKPVTFAQSVHFARLIGSVAGDEPAPYCGLTQANAKRIDEALVQQQRRIAQAFWGRSWSDVFEEFEHNLPPANDTEFGDSGLEDRLRTLEKAVIEGCDRLEESLPKDGRPVAANPSEVPRAMSAAGIDVGKLGLRM